MFTVSINSLARVKAKKEAENFRQIASNIAKQKSKLLYIISEHQTDTVKQKNVFFIHDNIHIYKLH